MKKFFEKLKAVDEVITSLKTNPEQWKFNSFQAVNRETNSSVWYFNHEYGLEFKHKGIVYCGPSVTYFSSLLGWLVPWRRKLVSTFKQDSVSRGFTPNF